MSAFSRRELLATMAAVSVARAVAAEREKPPVESNEPSARHRADAAADGWVATWASSTRALLHATRAHGDPCWDGFEDQTVRQFIFTSAGGDAVRIRLSNKYGRQPLRIGKAAIGVKRAGQASDAGLLVNSVVPITFAGAGGVTIAAGEEIASDIVSTTILPHQTIAIDLYLPQKTGSPEVSSQLGLTYRAAGDRTGVADGDRFLAQSTGGLADPVPGWYYLRRVDVHNPQVKDVIVCGADSLSHSTFALDGHVKWPQILSRRLRAAYGDAAPSVVQSSLIGNRLLTSGPMGPCVMERFEADLLSPPGVTQVILWAGFNDLIYPNFPEAEWTGARTTRSARELIDGYVTLARKAHARGIRIFGATISPGRDAGMPIDGRWRPLWSEASEATRRQVNEWFRSAGAKVLDGIFDFAALLENPLDRSSYDPSCCSDGVHPNAGGHYAIAHAVDIEKLMKRS